MLRWGAQEWEALLWLYEHSNGSDWLLGCVSVFGNRCDVFKQVGITGMSGIPPLYRTLNVLSPAGKLSLGHMLQSHITLTPWLPAPHQHPAQPLPNPLPDHQLSCPIWVSPLPQPSFSSPSNAPLLFFLEWKWIPHALFAGGGRRWRSVQVGRKVVFFLLHAFSCERKKASGSALCQFDEMHRQGQNETTQKK